MNRKVLAGGVSAVFLLVAIFTVMQLPGCGGGGGGTPAGTLQVGITDARSVDFTHVFINISSVKVAPHGSEHRRDNDTGLPTIATFPGGRQIDILSFGVGTTIQEILGTAVIPAGSYTQVRLILKSSGNSVTTVGCGTVPLQLPSETETGIKMPLKGLFTVTAGTLNTILIDFDPNTAIVQKGNCRFLLKPTGIRVTQILTSLQNAGSISGLIHTPAFNLHSSATFKSWSSALVTVRQNSTDIASGVAFSNFSSPDVWKGPFTAFVPAGLGYKVFVTTFRDTNLQIRAPFQVYSSPLPLITVTQGVDTPVPPDGIALLKAL
ncbi:MAG TPA: DUF4382 domain-containing protein [Geobacteraceae bacterium]